MDGMVRAVFHGLFVAMIFAGLLALIAHLAPNLAFNYVSRPVMALAITWMIFGIVEDAAGMTGWFTSIWSGLLSIAVVLSTNFIMAESGVVLYTRRGRTVPAEELIEPATLAATSIAPVCAVLVVAVICWRGTPGGCTLGDILTLRIWWGAW